MAMYRSTLAVLVFLAVSQLLNAADPELGAGRETRERYERLLPPSDDARCDPTVGNCRKGDWVDESIADCNYDRGWWPPYTCTAIDSGGIISWVVQPDEDDKCRPARGKRITCGAPGTNTRCVCSDYKIKFDTCICQYWTEETPGENQPAFCTGHYLGGISEWHHWACCNNCNDPVPTGVTCNDTAPTDASGDDTEPGDVSGDDTDPTDVTCNDAPPDVTCDGHTYQGGSSEDYCGKCGENGALNKGQRKYYFSCGGCEVQAACESRCNRETVYQTWPGFCWKWLDCFKGCCQRAVTQPYKKRRSTAFALDVVASMEFCGDGRCSTAETPGTCPVDCCYQINSAVCTSNATCCTPSCCQTETCCLDTDLEGGSAARKECLQTSAVLLVLLAVAALVQ